jgi:hypothetical protein
MNRPGLVWPGPVRLIARHTTRGAVVEGYAVTQDERGRCRTASGEPVVAAAELWDLLSLTTDTSVADYHPGTDVSSEWSAVAQALARLAQQSTR